MVNCWEEILKLKGKTLKTLDQGNPFDVLEVNNSGVVVNPRATQNERYIPRKHVEGAFMEFVRRGEISRSDIERKYSPRNPAYVAAMLASFPGVIHTTKPIKLKFER